MRVSTTFDFARRILLVEAEGAREVARGEMRLRNEAPGRKARALRDAGVRVVICGAVSRSLARAVAQSGIGLFPLVTGAAEEVLAAYLGGRLDDPRFLLPGTTPDQKQQWRHALSAEEPVREKSEGDTEMTIAITSLGETVESPVDQRFGRARFFVLYELQNGEWCVHGNRQNLEAAQGAGIQAAQRVAELGAEAVITGHCGPKAFATLQAAGIDIYQGASGSVREAIDAYRSGSLKVSRGANAEAGFGSV